MRQRYARVAFCGRKCDGKCERVLVDFCFVCELSIAERKFGAYCIDNGVSQCLGDSQCNDRGQYDGEAVLNAVFDAEYIRERQRVLLRQPFAVGARLALSEDLSVALSVTQRKRLPARIVDADIDADLKHYGQRVNERRADGFKARQPKPG
jgi:hypothetical protein